MFRVVWSRVGEAGVNYLLPYPCAPMTVTLQGHELALETHLDHSIASSAESETEMSRAENAHTVEIGANCFSPSPWIQMTSP